MKDNFKRIIFATSNKNKINEVSNQLSENKIRITSLKELDINEDIPETADSFKGNALQKSKHIYDRFGINVFSEDTGLEVFSLGMTPGVKTARYAGAQRNDNDNMQLLLDNLKDIEDRSAQFKTVVSLIYDDKEYFFEGIVKGKIAMEQSGDKGFGYDPIFIPNGYDKSFAHFTKEEKNKISHRGQAISKLIHFLCNI